MFHKTAAFYDAIYSFKDYDAEAKMLREIIAARCPQARTLLDVACGTGKHLELLAPYFEVTGLDLDAGLLGVARQRLPNAPLIEGDMTNFALGRIFDVVTCLFSAIGYVLTVERLNAAVRCMAAHLTPGGVLIIEPWLKPEEYQTPHVSMRAVDEPDLKIARVTHSTREGNLSVMEFQYLVGTPEGITHYTEEHRVALFTQAEYEAAFTAAELTVEYDPVGLMGRGLYIGMSSKQHLRGQSETSVT